MKQYKANVSTIVLYSIPINFTTLLVSIAIMF